MHTFIKPLALVSLVGSSLLAAPMALAELSGNVGVVSDYFYRGIDQGTGATASAGLDYGMGNGVAVGIWGADVGDGIEYDLYGSYVGEQSGFSYSVGYTGYYYTGEFDDTYTEINLGAGYGPVSLEYASGSYANFTGPEQDYTFTAITAEKSGFYITAGSFGSDFKGSYTELGYGAEISGMEMGVALISADEDLSQVDSDGDSVNEAEVSMVFNLTKGFEI